MKTFISFAISISVAFWGASLQSNSLQEIIPQKAKLPEMLYLPNGEALGLVSFGYRGMLSNLIWFHTLSYFGKHFRGNKDYKWLSHMCSLTTELDPRALRVVEFCANMLSWEIGKPEASVKLLSDAIRHHPNSWKLLYLRGFTTMYFLKDEMTAHGDFVKAASIPGAHPIVVRLAAKQLGSLNSPETAIEFLKGILISTKDRSARIALDKRLRELYRKQFLNIIHDGIKAYHEKFGSFPLKLKDLKQQGILKKIPVEPFGKRWVYESEKGLVN